MRLEVEYTGFDDSAIAAAFRVHVDALLHVLPGWLYELNIRLRDDGQNCATAHVDSRYARAVVQVWPGLLIDRPEVIRAFIAHEFAHIIMGGLTERVTELASDEPSLNYHLERATEDVSRAVLAACSP